MSKAKHDALRIAHWPGYAIPVPDLSVGLVELNGRFLDFGLGRVERVGEISPTSRVAVPDELYLREFLDLDCSDPPAVLAFCTAYGQIGEFDLSDLPDPISLIGFGSGEVEAVYEERNPPESSAIGLYTGSHVIANVAAFQSAMWFMVGMWRCLVSEDPAEEMKRFQDEAGPLASPHLEGIDLASELSYCLSKGLTPYHVRLEALDGPPPWGIGNHNVYNAMCLQLANHIVDYIDQGLVYKQCGNETCRRLFVRQRGRMKQANVGHRENRTGEGVRYCSASCQRTQVSREWRRKNPDWRRKTTTRESGQDTSTKRRGQA